GEGNAAAACEKGAVVEGELNRTLCAECRDAPCVFKWRNRCFEVAGFEISADEILERSLRERGLYGGDGGVTFGGGEPTLQHRELRGVWRSLRAEGISVAVETNASTAGFAELVGEDGLFICDLKCFSSAIHKRWTGAGNERILENLRLGAAECAAFRIRVPLVPGFNTDRLEMEEMAGFLAELRGIRGELDVEVLRMHHMGAAKYAALGLDYPMADVPEPSMELQNEFETILRAAGVTVENLKRRKEESESAGRGDVGETRMGCGMRVEEAVRRRV
ncbi:MAG: radical SAM protein, partial [Kiritimatiellaeota bacterium]|nr:radical SAM protein [Kiritimatiellota bacterium]